LPLERQQLDAERGSAKGPKNLSDQVVMVNGHNLSDPMGTTAGFLGTPIIAQYAAMIVLVLGDSEAQVMRDLTQPQF
jgi:hypothetical protein